MPKLTVNGEEIEVEAGTTVMQACQEAGAEIPHFCFHQRLSIAGNCRMCLVEMEKSPKPIASCAMPAGDGMVIHTDTDTVKKAREGVMEFLLINHPLDCPICDQGGECDLQDQAMAYGRGKYRYHENKRAVTEKYMGPLIKTIMTRCIHCTRCIRFAEEVGGVQELGAIYRGENMQITTYLEQAMDSELSANVIDLCPVGALTSAPYAFEARPWELRKIQGIDVMDAVGSNIRIDVRGREVMRILPRLHEDINEEWISDKTRYACDGLRYRRLDRPYVRRGGTLEETNWDTAFRTITEKLNGLQGSQIAGVVGDLADMESMFSMKGLLTELGSDRIECRQDGAALDTTCRAGYLFNTTIAGIENAELCLLVGTNPRHEAAIVNARILKATRHSGLKVANIGPELDLMYPVEQLGNDISILNDLVEGNHEFSKRLMSAERPMIILGQGALSGPDGAAVLKAARDIADKYDLVGEGWNGFNVLHTAASRVGALDLGLVTDGGIASIRSDVREGALKAVFLLGADECDADELEDAFVIFIGSHGDRGVQYADVILPGAAFTEKPGLYINTEGRVQQSPRTVFPPGQAREDWKIFRALSEYLGRPLPFDDIDSLRQKLAEVVPHSESLDTVAQADWGEFGTGGKIKSGEIILPVSDFYRTNSIARASRTMAECSEVKYGTAEKATGTDG